MTMEAKVPSTGSLLFLIIVIYFAEFLYFLLLSEQYGAQPLRVQHAMQLVLMKLLAYSSCIGMAMLIVLGINVW